VRGLARHLHAAGWTVRAPLLPGHGRTLDAFARATGDEWRAAVHDALAEVRARHAHVVLVGVSMGGALATALVADAPPNERPDRLVLLAPYLATPRAIRAAAAAHGLVALVAPWIESRNPRSIRDAAARAASRGYGVVAPHLLRELVRVVARGRRALAHVDVPTFVVHSRLDNRIAPAAATAAFARLGAADKTLTWLDGSGHVITVDHERERVYALVTDWLKQG
jgi:carboxylesterase